MNKKKLVITILIPVLAIITALGLASAYFSNANAGDFVITGDTLTRYNGNDESVIIPDDIKNIGDEAFAGNPFIKKVVLSDECESIGREAFSNCIALEQVDLSDSLINIKESAFSGCINLKKIDLPVSLESIGDGALANCEKLEDINASGNFICEDGVLYNSDKTRLYAFLAGNKMVSYNMPSSVRNIAKYAFWGTKNLKEIQLSTALSSVPTNVFYGCTSIEHIIIREPVNNIEFGAFQNCSSIKEIELPISVSSIYNNAFDNCPSDMIFVCDGNSKASKLVSDMGYKTSSVCTYVLSENIVEDSVSDSSASSDNIDEVESDVIAGEPAYKPTDANNDISAVMLGNSKVVSDRVFVMTDGFTVHDGSEYTSSVNNESDSSSNSVISEYQFYNKKGMDDFTFTEYPDVKALGMLSFARSDISKLSIPDGVVSIGYGAFYHCDNLTELSIPASVKSIDAFALDYTPWFNNWKSSDNDYLIVGDGVLYAYKGSESDVIIPDGVKFIAPNSFSNHNEIESITFPDSLVAIGEHAFYGCDIVTINNLSDAVTLYGESDL